MRIARSTIPAGTRFPWTLHLPYWPRSGLSHSGRHDPKPTDITLVGLRPLFFAHLRSIHRERLPVRRRPRFSPASSPKTRSRTPTTTRCRLRWRSDSRTACSPRFPTPGASPSTTPPASKTSETARFRATGSLSLFDARAAVRVQLFLATADPEYKGSQGKVLNGWAVSGIYSFQTGFPIRIQSSDDNELMNSFDLRAARRAGSDLRLSHSIETQRTGLRWPRISTPTRSALPGAIRRDYDRPSRHCWAIRRRTICCGPGINNFDFSVQKITPLGESMRFEFRAEFFNLSNHTQFFNPDGNITDGADFGRVKRTRDPRQMQFALKFFF